MAPLFHYASYGSRSKFFFGFGGFPPVCLTDTLAPDEDADLLLLGGGDVRDLLYTLFVDEAHGRFRFHWHDENVHGLWGQKLMV